MKALIVEDDIVFLTEIKICLSMMEWESDDAMNGYDAIKLLQKNEYDLIITDIMMSEMSGIKLIDYIKQKYKTPILVMTCMDLNYFDKIKYPYVWNKIGLDVLQKLIKKAINGNR